MPESFMRLPRDERAGILTTASTRLGQGADVLEKDVWVCWALDVVFGMSGCPSMVFKGGTSLSKVYDAIKRFSEDIDVTISYQDLGIASDSDPLRVDMSKSQVKRTCNHIKNLVASHIEDTLLPYFKERLQQEFPEEVTRVYIGGNDKEKLFIDYPSAIDEVAGYMPRRVLLEFGGRNLIEPNERHRVVPTLMGYEQLGERLSFPTPTVPVLAAEKTFWEKVTLIHAANTNTRAFAEDPEKLRDKSRHWYDVLMLYEHEIGGKAVKDSELLRGVIRVKSCLFPEKGVDYHLCEQGLLQLVPRGSLRSVLEKDYLRMTDSSMFRGVTVLPFNSLMDRLGDMQDAINAKYR